MRQAAAKLQFQLLAVEEGSGKHLEGERQRTAAAREELRLAEENADVMREALQVTLSFFRILQRVWEPTLSPEGFQCVASTSALNL